jgi:hypothetical protein
VGLATGETASSWSGVPQEPQNRFWGEFSAPHVGHGRAIAVPHCPQKRWPAGTSVPQAGQVVT